MGEKLLFDGLTLGPTHLIVSLATLAWKKIANERYLLMTQNWKALKELEKNKQITLGTGALGVRSCVTTENNALAQREQRHRSASICLASLNLQKQGTLFSFLLTYYQERSTETANNYVRVFSKGWRDYFLSKCNRAHSGHRGEA